MVYCSRCVWFVRFVAQKCPQEISSSGGNWKMNGDKESLGELIMTLNTASLNDETGPWRSFYVTSFNLPERILSRKYFIFQFHRLVRCILYI